MSDTVLDPGRVAHASIQGYLYQAYLGVERWLELKDDEVLRCEGDEDLDRLLRDGSGGWSEQVKAYTGDVNIRDEVVQETLRRFLVSHHRLRTAAEPDLRRFLFTSTATRRRQKTDDRYPVDVLAVWEEAKEEGAVRSQVVGVLRTVLPLEETADRPASRRFAKQLQEALVWLDGDAERWADLIRSVEWRLGEPQLTDLRGKIDQALNRVRPGAPPNLRDRLLSEVLDASIAPEPRDRCRTREQLVALLDQAEAEVARWLATARGYGLVKRLEELDHLRPVLYDKPLELPPSPSPSKLLVAAYEVIPFDETGREEILEDFAGWCAADRKRLVRLIHGDGGLGKTRLLIEWCRRLAAQGWIAGFLEPTTAKEELAPLLQGTLPRLVVIDYAETRLDGVRTLVSRLAHGNDGPKVRLVLLARREGDWWESLKKDDATEDLLDSTRPQELPRLLPGLEERRQAFRTAAHAFAQHLHPQETKDGAMSGALGLRGGWRRPDGGGDGEDRTGRTGASLPTTPTGGGPTPTPGGGGPTPTLGGGGPIPTPGGGVETPQSALHERTGSTDVGASPGFSTASPTFTEPDLTDEAFGRPLYLHMAALAATLGHPVTRAADALAETLKRERRYWQDEVQDLDDAIRLDLEEALPAAVTALTLLGGLDTKAKAQELTRRLLPEAGKTTAKLLATLLHRLYSAPPDSGRHLGGLEPDLLGEELVWQELQQNRDALHTALDLADPEGSKKLLTVLTRLAQRPERATEAAAWLKAAFEAKLDDLAEPALEVAVVQGDPVGVLLAQAIQERASLELAKRIMDRCDGIDLQYSVPLREVALHSTYRVYEELRKLRGQTSSEAEKEDARNELSRVASNLGGRLADIGQHEQAFQAMQEAVDLLRPLARQRPSAFRPYLSLSLSNLGLCLMALGRTEEALQATLEAVAIERSIIEEQSAASRVGLAHSLNSHFAVLSTIGHHQEALKAIKEATDLYRTFVQEGFSAFKPDLARSLTNQGICLRTLRRHEHALQVSREAAELYGALAQERFHAFGPSFAKSLHNLGMTLRDLNQREEGLRVTQQAVEIRRLLALHRPAAFNSDLANSLNNLGLLLSELGRHVEALRATQKAVDLYRLLADQCPTAFGPYLAMSLGNLSRDLSASSRQKEALAAAEEGVRMLAPFFLRNPLAFEEWMTNNVRFYRQRCEESGLEPDPELLNSIEAVLASLKEEQS